MAQALVAVPADRFLPGSSATRSVSSGRRSLAGAALASLFLQSLGVLGLALLDRPFEPVAASRAIDVEVVIAPGVQTPAEPSRERPAEPARKMEQLTPSIETASSGVIEPSAAQPEQRPRPDPSSTLGLNQFPAKGAPVRVEKMRRDKHAERATDSAGSATAQAQELIRAVPVPMPAEHGDETMRYDVAVVGNLERAKQFPRRASQRRARGTAVVGFALDDAGRVLVAALLRSSGDRDLDGESLAVIHRAAPFPKPPPGARRTFAVDISFRLGG